MKKVLKVLSATMLSAVVAASAVASVSAAEKNENEDAILDELQTSVDLGGNETYIPKRYVNQTENYFLEEGVDITEEQADEVIEKIGAVKDYLENADVESFGELSDEQIDEIVALANEAAGVVGLKLSYDKATGDVTVITTGSEGGSTKGGSSGRNSSGQVVATVNTNGTDNTVKTTGFDIPGVSVIAGVGVLFVTAAGVYLIRTSKKERVDA